MFGFNGHENDDEVKGVGNSVNFGARIYDPRLGKFLSVDPWTYKYSWQTPYAYHRNSPINFIDWKGLGDPGDKDEPFAISEITVDGGNRTRGVYLEPSRLSTPTATIAEKPATFGVSDGMNIISGLEKFVKGRGLHFWTNEVLSMGTETVRSKVPLFEDAWKGKNGKLYPMSQGGNRWAGKRPAMSNALKPQLTPTGRHKFRWESKNFRAIKERLQVQTQTSARLGLSLKWLGRATNLYSIGDITHKTYTGEYGKIQTAGEVGSLGITTYAPYPINLSWLGGWEAGRIISKTPAWISFKDWYIVTPYEQDSMRMRAIDMMILNDN
ncbi:hypothetical protein N8482_03575 [Chitinophagales bacterium]|nr:hypothetical protein [Chitinophagales bacterium]